MENSIIFCNIEEGTACDRSHYLILNTTTSFLLDYTRFTITDRGPPRLPSLYNQVPGAGSVALADTPDGALYCFVDLLRLTVITTADPSVLVAIAASIQPATLVSVPGTAKRASDGCTE